MSLEKVPNTDNYLTSFNNIFNFKLNQKNKKNSKESSSLINDEYCYNCNEGGNLINCDRCPASFHLLCHNPPLEIDKIPKGEFLCNKCKNYSRIGVKHGENKTTTVHFEKYETDSALDTLCRMAKSLNPKEMNLSSEMNLHCEFSIPGLSRMKWFESEYRLKTFSYQNKSSNSSTNNRRMCHLCSKFEWSKKMIKCDYCESMYHQDCLLFFINEIPTKDKIWMCPLHCEHILNKKFLKSDKLSDQIKLWNEFELYFKKQNKIEYEFIQICNSNSINNELEKPIHNSRVPATIKNLYNIDKNHDDSSCCFSEIFSAVEALNLLSNKTKEIKIKIASLDRHDLIKPKALLKFVFEQCDLFEYPVPLIKSCTSLGKSAKNDICLDHDIIQCKHLSDKHATIFYDYITNKYEILNYSQHGIKVDNVSLGFELDQLEKNHLAAYEGSVELKHGSLIQIGCFKILFVILDYELNLNLDHKQVTLSKFKNGNKKKFKINKQTQKSNKIDLINNLEKLSKISGFPELMFDPEITVLQKFISNPNKKNLFS